MGTLRATALLMSLLLAVAACSGCHYTRHAVDMRAVESELAASCPAPAGPDGPGYATLPRRVALVRLEPAGRLGRSQGSAQGPAPVRLVNEAATERQSEDLASRVRGVEVVTLAESVGPGSECRAADLLALGRSVDADWLVPFTVQTGNEPNLNVLTLLTLPAHLATGGFLPIQGVSADSTLTAIVLDVRSGRVIDRFERREDAWQLTNLRGAATAGRQAGDRAENRALRRLLDSVDDRIESLSAAGGVRRAASGPASGWGED